MPPGEPGTEGKKLLPVRQSEWRERERDSMEGQSGEKRNIGSERDRVGLTHLFIVGLFLLPVLRHFSFFFSVLYRLSRLAPSNHPASTHIAPPFALLCHYIDKYSHNIIISNYLPPIYI